MNQLKNSFKDLTKFEWTLWMVSVVIVAGSFMLAPEKDYLTLTASLIGVTALIFVAKGYVLGQILTVIFALFYGFISFYFRYYGEMITYLFMTAPMAIVATVEWIRHPYKESVEVKVAQMTGKKWGLLLLLSIVVTYAFYFILAALDTANLVVSTISVTTSFLASGLTFLRSPYYALAYAANDIVLIILWVMASIVDISYLPMILCFVMFFANDIYGFLNWRRMEKRQAA
ncbi:MAG: nicotinamide mononucleotide transporter [Lachnospiraceae bacterium]|nr:nicotinamide mononucleotide transporter [Lachnospiraceae bacterium]